MSRTFKYPYDPPPVEEEPMSVDVDPRFTVNVAITVTGEDLEDAEEKVIEMLQEAIRVITDSPEPPFEFDIGDVHPAEL